MTVNYAPIPMTWMTPITVWSMRRMELHLVWRHVNEKPTEEQVARTSSPLMSKKGGCMSEYGINHETLLTL